MARNIANYAEEVSNFHWQVPAYFNFGVDVVDRLAREADGPALVWADSTGRERRFDFSDIARLTDRLASGLRACGVAQGDRVIVMLPRIPEWQIAMVACMKLGAVPIPCIEMLTAKDIAYRLDHSGATAVIARAEQAHKFAAVDANEVLRVCVGAAPGWRSMEAVCDAGAGEFVPARVAAEDPALLYYTSGATGQPKGVLHAARAVYAWRESARSWLDLGRGDTIWCTADTGWSKAATSILIGPWSQGACSFFHDGPFVPAERLRLLARHRISVYCAPGTELFRLLDEDIAAHDLSGLRHVVSAGEALNPVVSQRWFAATGIAIAEAYGQTESLMTLVNLGCMPQRTGSMGLPNPGTTLEVLDSSGNVLPPGEEGDVAILTPNPQIMLGYWKDPVKTAECYLAAPDGRRWFITGDRGVRDADGYFYHRGRRDDVINSAGYRIGPAEVENALLDHPAVLECAAVGLPDRERGEIVKAFIVLRPGVEPSEVLKKALQDHVKHVTAPYKYPRAIEFLGELPKTLTGKIQRAALRLRDRASVTARPSIPGQG